MTASVTTGRALRYAGGSARGLLHQLVGHGQAPRLTLLYPHHAGLGDEEGIRARFRVSGQETVLETASFDISNGKELVDRVLNRIRVGIEEAPLVLQ